MKKLFSLLALSLATFNASAYYWSFTGNAAPTDWTDNGEAKQVNAFTKDNNGQLVWIGKLKTGGEGFKITRNEGNDFGGWGDVHPSTPGLNIAEVGTDIMQYGGGDTKWTISSDGIYKMTIDEKNNTLTCVSYTPTIEEKDGWYELGTAADLYEFAELVSHDAIARNCKVKLTADIDFTAYKYASIGRSKDFAFEGEFDGQGHTITIDMVGIYARTGLFAYIKAATIKNLVVEGTATSNDRNCIGGLGGRSDSDGTLIQNVVVKTAVEYTGTKGDATCGGLFANMEAKVRLENCAFYGSINTGTAEGNGGLVGWAGSGSNNVYTNCIVAPTEYTKNGNSGDFARNNPTVTNCVLTSANDARLASGELCFLLNGKVSGGENWYQTLPGDAYPVPLATHGKVYANGTFYCDGTSKGGDVVYANTNENITDPHAFNGGNGWCTACGSLDKDYLKPTDGYYSIGTANELKWFAVYVNTVDGSANAKLTADINMTGVEHTPIGTSSNKYKGTFDGQNHTVDNIVIEGKSYSGFFGYLTGGANIQNLVIGKGCAFSGDIKIGGLASMAASGGTVTLSRIVNMASATSSTTAGDANAAGFISCCIDGTKVEATNCLNAGTIAGKPGECAAFTGWSQGGSKYTNCLNIAEISGMQDNRNLFRGDATAVTCYDATYSTQGTKVDAAKLATGELCFIMNNNVSGGESWYQTLPGDDYPVPLTNHGKVYQNGDYYCDHVTAKGSASYSNTEGATYDEHVFGKNDLCTACKAAGLEPGKDGDVYQIGNIGQLVWFAASVNAGNTEAQAVLTTDIAQGEAKYTPIGSAANPYKGVFKGDFHTVTLAMESENDYQGLFGVLTGGAEIYNLTTAGSVKGKSFVGGIAGGTNGGGDVKFYNCGNEATVEATNANGGGILGVDMGSAAKITMKNCYNAGAISGPKENGGLSGWAGDQPYITNCYNSAGVENGDSFIRCNGNQNFNNTYGKDNISDAMLASGDLCYKLGDVNFRQEIGVDGHPVLSDTKPNVSYVGEAGYATMYDKTTGYELNGDVKAHVAVINGERLKLTEIGNVPESTPVILKGSYYNKIAAELSAINVTNHLIGTSEEMVADGTQYVLAKPEGEEVGFYRATASTTIAAGKAYIKSSADVKAFYFADEATGISNINENVNVNANATIYNLAGQRIQKMQKGINIMNGKKIAIR